MSSRRSTRIAERHTRVKYEEDPDYYWMSPTGKRKRASYSSGDELVSTTYEGLKSTGHHKSKDSALSLATTGGLTSRIDRPSVSQAKMMKVVKMSETGRSPTTAKAAQQSRVKTPVEVRGYVSQLPQSDLEHAEVEFTSGNYSSGVSGGEEVTIQGQEGDQVYVVQLDAGSDSDGQIYQIIGEQMAATSTGRASEATVQTQDGQVILQYLPTSDAGNIQQFVTSSGSVQVQPTVSSYDRDEPSLSIAMDSTEHSSVQVGDQLVRKDVKSGDKEVVGRLLGDMVEKVSFLVDETQGETEISTQQGTEGSQVSLQTDVHTGQYLCTLCGFQAPELADVQKHTLTHSNQTDPEKIFQCETCGYCSENIGNVKRHILSHNKDRHFACGICGKMFTQRTHCERHMKTKHTGSQLKCYLCGFACPAGRASLLTNHLRAQHPDKLAMHSPAVQQEGLSSAVITAPVSQGVSGVNVANAVVSAAAATERTVMVTMAASTCTSSGGGGAGLALGNVPQHLMEFCCEQCDFKADSHYDLKQHLKFHKAGPELKLYCTQCTFVTACQSRLDRHMLKHTQEKPHYCPMCPYRGGQKIHVMRHAAKCHSVILTSANVPSDLPVKRRSAAMIRALGEYKEPSPASAATAAIARNANAQNSTRQLKKYEQINYNVLAKNFNCPFCTLTFAKLISLYKHLYTQHKDLVPPEVQNGLYHCIICDFCSNSKEKLMVHFRQHTNHSIITSSLQRQQQKLYQCALCEFQSPDETITLKHVEAEHNLSVVGAHGDVTFAMKNDAKDQLQVGIALEKVAEGTEASVVAEAVDSLGEQEKEATVMAVKGLQALQGSESTFTDAELGSTTQLQFQQAQVNGGAAVTLATATGAVNSVQPGEMIEIDGEMYRVQFRNNNSDPVQEETITAPAGDTAANVTVSSG